MAYDFPASPGVGQVFTPAGGPSWIWDGTVWKFSAAAAVAIAPVFNAYMSQAGGFMFLYPRDGNRLFINGALYTIPPTGVSLNPAGVAASTVYFIYAYASAGAIALEYSTTVPVNSADGSHRIKTGDASRVLVGMATSAAAGAWSVAACDYASWFNPTLKTVAGPAGNPGLTSTSIVELASLMRRSFVSFGGRDVKMVMECTFSYHSTAGQDTYFDIGLDGVNMQSVPAGSKHRWAATGASDQRFHYVEARKTVTEGGHYITPVGWVTAGTGTIISMNARVTIMG